MKPTPASLVADPASAPVAAPKLVLDRVTKQFGQKDGQRTTALDGVSLEVADETFVALIGPSGCGKTTVLRIANGLILPDTGSVLLSGRPPQPGAQAGFVFQSFRLIPWATVAQNITFALDALPLTGAERTERVRHYLALVGLSRVADSYPAQLSGGMRQRVALARALAVEPEMLLMDEPFASLDAQTRELMQAELMAIWTRRRAMVLFVTHSVDEAIVLADRIVVMGAGRVLEVIDVDLERPRWSPAFRAERRFIELRSYLWNRIRDLVLTDPRSDFYGRDPTQE